MSDGRSVRAADRAPVADPPETAPAPGRQPWQALRHPGSEAGAAAWTIVALSVGIVLGALGAPGPTATFAFAAGVAVGGWRPGLEGLDALRRGRLDVDLLMVVAAVAAAALGEWLDATLLIAIFATSGALETAAEARTEAGVRALLVDRPEHAERFAGPAPATSEAAVEVVPSADLASGDLVLVRQGARVPADGTVLDGEAAVDESSLTGEPLPAHRTAGAEVLAGATIVEGALVVRVDRPAADSVLARLADAVEEAVSRRPAVQRWIDRIEQRYSVGVVVAAVALAASGPTWIGWTGADTLERTMTFLVVASPCAVVLATMPATLSALAAAARHRVLLRGSDVLERLAEVDLAAFDKTGTLTSGVPTVVSVTAHDPGTEHELLADAAAVERWSEHPIGRAIVAEAAARGIAPPMAAELRVLAGRGVEGRVAGRLVRVGGPALLGEHAIDAAIDAAGSTGTLVGVERDGVVVGLITLADRARPEAAETVARLDRDDIPTVQVTGDARRPAEAVAREVGISTVHHGLLPHEKAERLRELQAGGRIVAYVGDGVNDAAALAVADVGVSLGRGGSALANDTAGVVILDDDLRRLPEVMDLSRRARRLVRANLALALGAIAVLVTLDLAGRLPLVLGVIGHEGSSVLVALNGLRLLRWHPPPFWPTRSPLNPQVDRQPV
ncbi:MAG: heavy metal translocating P-type ATPase [Actinomycetota bacterium]|nr:heavy metal translocating P-type ATPase [Actinomycetota bacterium]